MKQDSAQRLFIVESQYDKNLILKRLFKMKLNALLTK